MFEQRTPRATAQPAKPVELVEEDFAPAWRAWQKTPNPATSDAVLQVVDPVIKSALRTYAGAKPSPTLQSRAKLIVLNSLPQYDPKQAKLRTYLMTQLQSLRRASAEEGQIISVPERVRLDQHRLHSAFEEMHDRLGRPPSDAELGRHIGVAIKRLHHIRKALPSLAEGQLDHAQEGGDDGDSPNLPGAPRRRDIYLSFIYGDLPPTDQYIMERTLGLHGHKTLPKGVIAKNLGLSASAISQRAARIQATIDRYEGRPAVAGF